MPPKTSKEKKERPPVWEVEARRAFVPLGDPIPSMVMDLAQHGTAERNTVVKTVVVVMGKGSSICPIDLHRDLRKCHTKTWQSTSGQVNWPHKRLWQHLQLDHFGWAEEQLRTPRRPKDLVRVKIVNVNATLDRIAIAVAEWCFSKRLDPLDGPYVCPQHGTSTLKGPPRDWYLSLIPDPSVEGSSQAEASSAYEEDGTEEGEGYGQDESGLAGGAEEREETSAQETDSGSERDQSESSAAGAAREARRLSKKRQPATQLFSSIEEEGEEEGSEAEKAVPPPSPLVGSSHASPEASPPRPLRHIPPPWKQEMMDETAPLPRPDHRLWLKHPFDPENPPAGVAAIKRTDAGARYQRQLLKWQNATDEVSGKKWKEVAARAERVVLEDFYLDHK